MTAFCELNFFPSGLTNFICPPPPPPFPAAPATVSDATHTFFSKSSCQPSANDGSVSTRPRLCSFWELLRCHKHVHSLQKWRLHCPPPKKVHCLTNALPKLSKVPPTPVAPPPKPGALPPKPGLLHPKEGCSIGSVADQRGPRRGSP